MYALSATCPVVRYHDANPVSTFTVAPALAKWNTVRCTWNARNIFSHMRIGILVNNQDLPGHCWNSCANLDSQIRTDIWFPWLLLIVTVICSLFLCFILNLQMHGAYWTYWSSPQSKPQGVVAHVAGTCIQTRIRAASGRFAPDMRWNFRFKYTYEPQCKRKRSENGWMNNSSLSCCCYATSLGTRPILI